MAHYRHVGTIPAKRHTQFRNDDGALHYEELMGEEGFSSDSSLLYHRGVPSAIVDSQVWELPELATTANHPLKPRHLKLHTLFDENEVKAVDPVHGRRLVLGNGDVRISYVVAAEVSPYYRNAVGDECVYVQSGSGRRRDGVRRAAVPDRRLRDAAAGDHAPLGAGRRRRSRGVRLYVVEANSHIAPPKRYLSRFGQLLEHAPYCERDLHGPDEPLLVDGTDVEVLVKHRGNGPGGSSAPG